ncbi:uncharacterized protein LOC133795708 [Humulus lupulus]|uniref:uncharacterized protein LOC133795708 n=1 Tax=Humulus lupulus TaxID=3486 RepID=UPI002B4134A5|nr:uncharacterized protein LOC133795708 [Humulus lupulus]
MKAQQGPATVGLLLFNQKREIHSRNKKDMEFIAKRYGALQEVDRVIDYAEFHDKRLIPLPRSAKENFELALEADNSNTYARYWLSRLHMKYHVPGACKAVGAALLVEAENKRDKNAQYELGCWLRVEFCGTSLPHLVASSDIILVYCDVFLWSNARQSL